MVGRREGLGKREGEGGNCMNRLELALRLKLFNKLVLEYAAGSGAD